MIDQQHASMIEPKPAMPTTPRAPALSIIVPTFREALNMPALIASIDSVRQQAALDLDVWIMDDQSRDGTREALDQLAHPWVNLVERQGPRGLSPAVIDGINASRGQRVIIMDADLSHPASAIPQLLAALDAGADVAVGSRNVAGASTDDDWGLFRWLNTKVATTLARPLAKLRDPMSGFVAFNRALLARAAPLNPVGYKIGLEIIVKGRAKRITEVPIHFADRRAGTSKLSFKQQMLYLEHLRRLYAFKLTDRRRPR